jgi:hypothetical protein
MAQVVEYLPSKSEAELKLQRHKWYSLIIILYFISRALVAHTCNPSYLGGRDQDCSSKPIWENSLRDPILKIPNTKNMAKWLKQ